MMRSIAESAKLVHWVGVCREYKMCVQAVRSRPAKVNDKLTTRLFGWSTRGFAASEDRHMAVCLLPGTELSFPKEVRKVRSFPWSAPSIPDKTAIFRKVNESNPTVHHDALEFPDGRIILVTCLEEGHKKAQGCLKKKGRLSYRPEPLCPSVANRFGLTSLRKQQVPTEVGTSKLT